MHTTPPDTGGSDLGAQLLDTRGDYCPLPLLKLRRTAARLEPGVLIEVWSSDPLATLDFEAWCLREGHGYTALPDADDYQRSQIRLGGTASAQ